MEYSESQVVNITQSSPGVHDRNWVTHTHTHVLDRCEGTLATVWVSVCVCVRACENAAELLLLFCDILTFSNNRKRNSPSAQYTNEFGYHIF